MPVGMRVSCGEALISASGSEPLNGANRAGLPEADFVASGRHGEGLDLLIVTRFGFGGREMGSSGRRLLNQSTQSRAANSTVSSPARSQHG